MAIESLMLKMLTTNVGASAASTHCGIDDVEMVYGKSVKMAHSHLVCTILVLVHAGRLTKCCLFNENKRK